MTLGSEPIPTLASALRAATLRLRATSPTPDLDGQLLLAEVLGWERARLLGRLDDLLSEEEASRYEALVDRRAAGEPVAYILGRGWFHGLRFQVSPAVLIPRPETEQLVDWGLAWLKAWPPPRARPPRVLDVGTGSGAIVLALAAAWEAERRGGRRPQGAGPDPQEPEWWATDLSSSALAVARANAASLVPEQRIHFVEADLWPPARAGTFDLVLANLPYVATDEQDLLMPDVLAFEPAEALFAGPDGLGLICRLVRSLSERLAPGGAVGLEIGYRQGEAVAALLAEVLPQGEVRVHCDLAGLERMVTGEATGPSRRTSASG